MDIVFPLVVRIASAQDHVSNFSLLFHHAVHLSFSHLGLCSRYLLIPLSREAFSVLQEAGCSDEALCYEMYVPIPSLPSLHSH